MVRSAQMTTCIAAQQIDFSGLPPGHGDSECWRPPAETDISEVRAGKKWRQEYYAEVERTSAVSDTRHVAVVTRMSVVTTAEYEADDPVVRVTCRVRR